MNDEQKYFNAVSKVLDVFSNPTQQADAIVKIPTPMIVDSSLNTHVLVSFIDQFKFDWDNYDDEDDEKFASETVTKISRILKDITENNNYRMTFKAETAYGKIADDEWLHEIDTESMKAKTIEEAKVEIDEIRRNTSKMHPAQPDFTLDFVRVRYDILDQNDIIVIKDELIPEEE